MVQLSVQAGFPSPADDFAVKRHDLNELLITHPLATFFWRVSGKSRIEAGIADGDILVVNRALTPEHRNIVVVQVDGDFTVKYRCGSNIERRYRGPLVFSAISDGTQSQQWRGGRLVSC